MDSKKLITPRLTQAEINAISSPATGEIVFNTNTNELNYYSGSIWISTTDGGGGGSSFADIWAATTLINC